MPLLQEVLLRVTTIKLASAMLLLSIAYTITGVLLTQKFISLKLLKANSGIMEPIFGAVAMMHTVLLAFVVVISWQNFDTAQVHVIKEAQCVANIYENSYAFKNPEQKNIQTLIKQYIHVAVKEEWQTLAKNQEHAKADSILNELWAIYLTKHLFTKNQEKTIFFVDSVHQLSNIKELRKLRIIDSYASIHPVLLYILLISSIIVITLAFLFVSSSIFVRLLTISTLSSILALMLLGVVVFSYPYTGDVAMDQTTYLQSIGKTGLS